MQKTRIILETDQLVPIPKAAKLIGIHFTTLYRWIKKNSIHTIKIGHQVFLERGMVQQLKKNRTALVNKS